MCSPIKIQNWLHEIAPIERAAPRSPIELPPCEAPPPSPATTSAEVVSLMAPPPSPAPIVTLHVSPEEPRVSEPSAAVQEIQSEKNATVLPNLVIGGDEHPNAIYMKTKMVHFIKDVMMSKFPVALWPDVSNTKRIYSCCHRRLTFSRLAVGKRRPDCDLQGTRGDA